MTICFKKLNEKATIPSFGHGDDTNYGVDFYSCLEKIVVIPPNGSASIPTGIAWQPIEVPYNHKAGMLIKSRSGLAIKNGVEASNAGVIDQGYTGEIFIKLYNYGTRDFVVENGMRIAQGIIEVAPKYAIIEVNELEETFRGDRGIGSSGRK
jgi:dUTP pyrophosphatase